MNLVRFKAEDIHLNQQDLEDLQALANMPDDDIDYSDIPKTQNMQGWVKFNTLTNKAENNVHVDEDIATWFNQKDNRTQAKINSFLRQLMAFEKNLA